MNDNDLRVVHSKDDKTALSQRSMTVEVAAEDRESITYFILPLRNGHLPIQATATSTLAADIVVRNLLVEVSGCFERNAK